MRQRTKVFVIFVVVLLAAIVLRIWQGYDDEARVRKFVQSRGGTLVSLHWAPLGPGWLKANELTRIYEICYVDRGGVTHQTYCRTNFSETKLDDDPPETK